MGLALDAGARARRRAGGEDRERLGRSGEGRGSASRRLGSAFLLAPYLRDTFMACGVISETFETGDHLGPLRGLPRRRDRGRPSEGGRGLRRARRGPRRAAGRLPLHPRLSGRAAPCFTVIAPRSAAPRSSSGTRSRLRPSEAVIKGGGTITHRHAVGHDHRPWYDRDARRRSAPLCGPPRRSWIPPAMLNPGVLIDHQRAVDRSAAVPLFATNIFPCRRHGHRTRLRRDGNHCSGQTDGIPPTSDRGRTAPSAVVPRSRARSSRLGCRPGSQPETSEETSSLARPPLSCKFNEPHTMVKDQPRLRISSARISKRHRSFIETT